MPSTWPIVVGRLANRKRNKLWKLMGRDARRDTPRNRHELPLMPSLRDDTWGLRVKAARKTVLLIESKT